jgi:hypothetical protein
VKACRAPRIESFGKRRAVIKAAEAGMRGPLSISQEHDRRRAEVSFKKPALTEAERAKAQDEATEQATRDKTVRLRLQRLAKEAADKQTASDGDQT